MKSIKTLLLAIALLEFSNSQVSAQQNWTLKSSLIQTRWTNKINFDEPLNEYPRPQLERKNWQNLNGLWDFAIVAKGTNQPSRFDEKILIPYPVESALSGVKRSVQPEQEIWYRRKFIIPEAKADQRILLNFGAVDWKATVYVNGKPAGKHEGGYTAFSFDITNLVNPGNNELAVLVWDPTDKGIGPHGKQVLNPSSIYYTPSSGIWQTVWLETVQEQYVSDLRIVPDVDRSNVKITVSSSADSEVYLTVAGNTVEGKTNTVITVPITKARLWSPDDPYLYDLTVKLGKDVVKSYFGMRKISVMKDEKGIERIALNNKPYYNLGVLDQGFWPDGLYTAPNDEALAFDIKASKAMGFNTIRKHIKVEPARWYYHADKMGMLVWQDLVNPNQSLPEGSKAEFEKESKEILDQLKNYPSIVTWVLFNEKWGQYDQERLTKMVKDTDPNRLVNGHSGEYLYVNRELRSPSPNAYVGADMTDVHSYPYPMMPEKQTGKAQVLGEFGGIGVTVEGHLFDDTKAGWGYDGTVSPQILRKQYVGMVDSLVRLKEQGLSGSIYTQPFDVETEQNGLLTYDREVIKLPVEDFREINAKLWPATMNYDKAARGFNAKIADTALVTFQQRLEQFNAGKRDSTFLRSFALMANKEHPFEAKKAANAYLQVVKAPFIEANINFMALFTMEETDPGYLLIKNNPEEIIKISRSGNVPAQLWDLIFKARFAPMLTSNPDWNEIEKQLNQYPLSGSKMLFFPILNSYMAAFGRKEPNALNNFFTAAFKFDQRYQIEGAMLNQVAWFLFEQAGDKMMLTQALAWARKSVDADLNSPYQMDTYANLLHKLGRTDEAVEWEKKALKLDPDNADMQKTLEKMENGVKTWKE